MYILDSLFKSHLIVIVNIIVHHHTLAIEILYKWLVHKHTVNVVWRVFASVCEMNNLFFYVRAWLLYVCVWKLGLTGSNYMIDENTVKNAIIYHVWLIQQMDFYEVQCTNVRKDVTRPCKGISAALVLRSLFFVQFRIS